MAETAHIGAASENGAQVSTGIWALVSGKTQRELLDLRKAITTELDTYAGLATAVRDGSSEAIVEALRTMEASEANGGGATYKSISGIGCSLATCNI